MDDKKIIVVDTSDDSYTNELTIADVLKIIGHSTTSTHLAELVHDKMKISQRHAHRRIKEAVKKGEILKSKFSNRKTVLYGLEEFGPPNDSYRIMYFDCGLDKLFGEEPQI